MSPTPIWSEVRTTYLVKLLERAIRSHMEEAMRDLGLTALQYTALSSLSMHPAMSSAQLSRRSFVSAQAGNEMIAALERKSLITRSPDEKNKRILRCALTPDGVGLLAKCDERMAAVERQMLGNLTSAEGRALQLALAACVDGLTADSVPAS